MGMIQIYNKKLPSRWINTTRYGKITYYDYLCREEKSMIEHGRKAKVKGGERKKDSRYAECWLEADKLF
ncbi:MAG: hypothetical protein ACFE9S_07440 [Candidatus Hermodarchaeota archaeon]